MTKNEFLEKIRKGLDGLPTADVERTLDFYKEIIEDRVEEGRTEEEAIAALGDVDLIIENVRKEQESDSIPAEKKACAVSHGLPEGVKKPLGVLISILSVIYSIVFYSVIIALGMSAIALGGVAISALPAAIVNMFTGTLPQVLLLLGVTAVGASLAILFAICTRLAVKYGRLVSKWLVKLAENIGN